MCYPTGGSALHQPVNGDSMYGQARAITLVLMTTTVSHVYFCHYQHKTELIAAAIQGCGCGILSTKEFVLFSSHQLRWMTNLDIFYGPKKIDNAWSYRFVTLRTRTKFHDLFGDELPRSLGVFGYQNNTRRGVLITVIVSHAQLQ